jgi:beta-phosphoglucomutase
MTWVFGVLLSNKEVCAILDASASDLKKEMFLQITNEALITKQRPDPEVYIKLLSCLNLDSGQVLTIEDSVSGLASANGAGLLTLVSPGEITSQTEFSGSYENISSLAQAVSYLD